MLTVPRMHWIRLSVTVSTWHSVCRCLQRIDVAAYIANVERLRGELGEAEGEAAEAWQLVCELEASLSQMAEAMQRARGAGELGVCLEGLEERAEGM
jgi:hypothetical protein